MTNFLNFPFSFQELLDDRNLEMLDQDFINSLSSGSRKRLDDLRAGSLNRREASAAILILAPLLENYVRLKFALTDHTLVKKRLEEAKTIFEAKVRFVRRFVVSQVDENAHQISWQLLCQKIGFVPSEYQAAQYMLKALDHNHRDEQILWSQLCKGVLAHPHAYPEVHLWSLFDLHLDRQDQKLPSPQNHEYRNENAIAREGFSLESSLPARTYTDDHAHYCLYCHEREKDYCATGHPQIPSQSGGCPLDQKISEMNYIYAQGHMIGALAIIMIDNPLVAATGHRICNACRQHCIFQKQEAVDIPSIESRIFLDVLHLPYGFEIYALLARWNPLKSDISRPLPNTQKSVLIVGQGPAGFALAHQLLNHGHNVVAIDAMSCADVRESDLNHPIHYWKSEDLQERLARGFGGVAEYGITVRWDKNYLRIIQILLRRRTNYRLYSSVRWGSQITEDNFRELGFDHVAFCTGTGHPTLGHQENHLAKGVRVASDFLMQLHLTSAQKHENTLQMMIEMPIVVVGGGLTAIDTATEALAFYLQQIDVFRKEFHQLDKAAQQSLLSSQEAEKAHKFLEHGEALHQARQSGRPILALVQQWGGVRVIYRGKLNESPAFRNFPSEIQKALSAGITFVENAEVLEIKTNAHNEIEAIIYGTGPDIQIQSTRTLFWATGFHPHPHQPTLDEETFITTRGNLSFSYFGDCHPHYRGSVVHALASAKKGAPQISDYLHKNKAVRLPADVGERCDNLLTTELLNVQHLHPNLIYFEMRALGCVSAYQSGQYFRLQSPGREPKVLFPALVCKDRGVIGFLAQASALSDSHLEIGRAVPLMGPVGSSLSAADFDLIDCSHHFVLQSMCMAAHQTGKVPQVRYNESLLSNDINDLARDLYPQQPKQQHHKSDQEGAYIRLFNTRQGVAKELLLVPIQCAMGGVCGRCLVDVYEEGSKKAVFACKNLWHNPKEIISSAANDRSNHKLFHQLKKYKDQNE